VKYLAALNEDRHVSMCADSARGKTTPSDAESSKKETDSQQEPNSKESDARVDGKSAAAAGAGPEDKPRQQEQMMEVKTSVLEGGHNTAVKPV